MNDIKNRLINFYFKFIYILANTIIRTMFKNINLHMLIAVGLHILIALGTHTMLLEDPEMRDMVNDFPSVIMITDIILGVSILLNITGLILLIFNKINLGVIIYMLGCFFFIPGGLLGIYGASKIKSKQSHEEFLKRKSQLS